MAARRRQPDGLAVKALPPQRGIALEQLGRGLGLQGVQLAQGLRKLVPVDRVAVQAVLQNRIQVAEGGRAGLGGLAAGLQDLLAGVAPLAHPALHAVQLVHRGLAAQGEALEHFLRDGIDALLLGDGALHVRKRAAALVGPLRGQLVHALEHAGGTGLGVLDARGGDAVLHQAQRGVLVVAQHVQPVVGDAVLVALDGALGEHRLQRGVEVAVGVVVALHGVGRVQALRAHGQQLVGGRAVRQPPHQALLLPVGERLVHGVLLQVQGAGHLLRVAAQLRVQRQHARIQVYAQKRLRRRGQIFQQEQVLDGRGIEHRRALGKAECGHGRTSWDAPPLLCLILYSI